MFCVFEHLYKPSHGTPRMAGPSRCAGVVQRDPWVTSAVGAEQSSLQPVKVKRNASVATPRRFLGAALMFCTVPVAFQFARIVQEVMERARRRATQF